MNWRNPKKELPKQGQKVWVMLKPHKERGCLLESSMSIEIVCGQVSVFHNQVMVDNYDELGRGCIFWVLNDTYEDVLAYDNNIKAIAWMPVEEMIFPDWSKK